ncbi:MAG: hypothetical protein Q4F66_12580 [Clostridium sp.]|nr:hypothetical protein [Clostridium sp.]
MQALIKALGLDIDSPLGCIKIFATFLIMAFVFNLIKDVLA